MQQYHLTQKLGKKGYVYIDGEQENEKKKKD
jgi:hypothetical protein